MEEDLRGRVAVVTGASSGIGEATAEMLARAGARVALVARSAPELGRISGRLPGSISVPADLVRDGEVDRLFEVVERTLGPCDLLVNNAGTFVARKVVDMTPAEWDEQFDVNIRAMFLCARRALPAMISRGNGRIVNVASISGVPGPEKFPLLSAYCASKAAVIAFTESLAVEVKAHGVRVNCISPGSVDTPMLRRAAPHARADLQPADIARIVLFLASDASRAINGQNIHAFSA